MCQIPRESNPTGASRNYRSFRKVARVSCVAPGCNSQGSSGQIAKRLGGIGAVGLLRLLFFIVFVSCAGIASAQTPPDQVTAAALGPSAVQVTFFACLSSDEGNCNYGFSIYRSPQPGFTQPPVHYAQLGEGTYAGSSKAIWMDTTVKGGQSYTYRVCTGGSAESNGSNCTTTTPVPVPAPAPPTPPPTVTLKAAATSLVKGQETDLFWTSTNATNLDLEPGVGKVGLSGTTAVAPGGTTTYTITATNPGGKATASVTIDVNCLTPWAPPSQVSALGGGSDIPLKWTNPNTKAGQTCPAPPSQVFVYRMGTNGVYNQLAVLDKMSNGTLPTRYTDNGPFQPHTGYFYEVCEGAPPNWQSPVNCASPPGVRQGAAGYGVVTHGADPILTATRVNATTVKLKISLDQFTVSSVTVIRQGSDDPCRQGGTLGNGMQGCSTTKIGPNGVGVSPAQTVTVYSWTESSASQYPPGFQNSQSAPFVINLPDDITVKPGVTYYYQAQVVWLWSVGQDSSTVTVLSLYATVPSQLNVGGGPKPIKLNGGPPPQSQSNAATAPMVSPTLRTMSPVQPVGVLPGAAIPNAATKKVQQNQ